MNFSLMLAAVAHTSKFKPCGNFAAISSCPIPRDGDDDPQQEYGAAEEAKVAEQMEDAQR
jgi:hypothetical protein